jgi:hypothetical protein
MSQGSALQVGLPGDDQRRPSSLRRNSVAVKKGAKYPY